MRPRGKFSGLEFSEVCPDYFYEILRKKSGFKEDMHK